MDDLAFIQHFLAQAGVVGDHLAVGLDDDSLIAVRDGLLHPDVFRVEQADDLETRFLRYRRARLPGLLGEAMLRTGVSRVNAIELICCV